MREVVAAYGGGVDSTAFLVRLVEERAPIRAILFADTGSELPRTYDYISTFSDWLEARGYPRVTVVRNIATRDSAQGAKKGVFESLEEQLLRLGNLPPAASNKHTCAQKMKIRPQNLWIQSQPWAREAWGRGERVLKLVGFDASEAYRANRAAREMGKDAERYELHFPLIEWGWDRARCEEVIAAAGLPSPGKSACFFCPFRKPDEIAEIQREHPELFQRALELEARALRSGRITSPEIKGLRGRRGTWAELAFAA